LRLFGRIFDGEGLVSKRFVIPANAGIPQVLHGSPPPDATRQGWSERNRR